MTKPLSEKVQVARRFQRSIRIDHDFGVAEALDGFVLLPSATDVLEGMVHQIAQTPQRAFTWTGPYGGGKSSLALAFASLLGSKGKAKSSAENAFGKKSVTLIRKILPTSNKGWLVLPIVGHRGNVLSEIERSLDKALCKPSTQKSSKKTKKDIADSNEYNRDLIGRLCDEADKRPKKDGVLVIIDEMGKFLEGAASRNEDIFFLQELAEVASRCSGKLVIVGILHQAFEQYAVRLGRSARDEWAKIQGRFSDIPISGSADEVVELVGRAIECDASHPNSIKTSIIVANTIQQQRPSSSPNMAHLLDHCWPLHPVAAALLGPISRHRFGQNERSCFGFLTSAEPNGFQDFLCSCVVGSGATFEVAMLWDYLQANLEPSILASPDGHRWAQAAEAIERCVARGDDVHIRLAKTVATIDMFKNGTGLAPSHELLTACLPELPSKDLEQAISDLEEWSVIVFRKHIGAYAVFAGSDFDIDAAVADARKETEEVDFHKLNKLAQLQPVVAKRHYHETGTLRWFEAELINLTEADDKASSFEPMGGSVGLFMLAIPPADMNEKQAKAECRKVSKQKIQNPVVVGLSPNGWLIRDQASELLALEKVQNECTELEGDAVARRELSARMAATRDQLEELLKHSFSMATWYVDGSQTNTNSVTEINQLASDRADIAYSEAPHIHSELANRGKPSSNAVAALNSLLHLMVEHPDEEALGIEGFPPERGLYETLLGAPGFHARLNNNQFYLKRPEKKGVGKTFQYMWKAAGNMIKEDTGEPINLSRLYECWSSPPFGLRSGPIPVYALAFLLAYENEIAIYYQGYFQPRIDTLFVDRMLQDPSEISLKPIRMSNFEKGILKSLSKELSQRTGTNCCDDPLSVAKRLVKLAFDLKPWTHKTITISTQAQTFRQVLLTAKDPHEALFEDIPELAKISDKKRGPAAANKISKLILELLDELEDAYPRMLGQLRDQMLRELGGLISSDVELESLQERARTVHGVTGDLRLDAFAMRLQNLTNDPMDMEAIASLAINKPSRDWTDRELDQAIISLAELALRFRQAEALAGVKGRKPTGDAISVVIGTGEDGDTYTQAFEVAQSERGKVSETALAIRALMESQGLDERMRLAVLAELGVRTIEELTDKDKKRGEVKKSA